MKKLFLCNLSSNYEGEVLVIKTHFVEIVQLEEVQEVGHVGHGLDVYDVFAERGTDGTPRYHLGPVGLGLQKEIVLFHGHLINQFLTFGKLDALFLGKP